MKTLGLTCPARCHIITSALKLPSCLAVVSIAVLPSISSTPPVTPAPLSTSKFGSKCLTLLKSIDVAELLTQMFFCNTRIKFGVFMDAIGSMEFDFVASGHYAKVVHPSADQMHKNSALELSQDMVKDQTYFLSHLSQDQHLVVCQRIKFVNLPRRLICPTKRERIPKEFAFLTGEKEGVILETGDFLRKHRGFWFYTIGQCQGLRLPGGPWYVVEKDVKNNVVFVSRNYFSVDKRRLLFHVGTLKWLQGLPPNHISQLQCKVRHAPGFCNCTLIIEHGEDGNEDAAVVHLSEDDQGLAAGQFVAFYQGRTCLGSGVILESWDDQGFSVCAKALENARIEDKSLLGKPVKIKVKPDTLATESCQIDGMVLSNQR